MNCLAGTAVGIPPECEPADTDLDSDVDVVDAAFFMRVFTGGFPDCNNNGTPDDEDIASEYSQDCNLNDVPDECDVLAVRSTPTWRIATALRLMRTTQWEPPTEPCTATPR